jgi:hypothetical protein
LASASEYKCISDHAEDLSGGQIVAPGESVKLTKEEVEDPHNARLIEESKLIPTKEPESAKGGGKTAES